MKDCLTYQVCSIQLRTIVMILWEILLVKAEATFILDALIQRHFVNFQFPSFSIICKKGEVWISSEWSLATSNKDQIRLKSDTKHGDYYSFSRTKLSSGDYNTVVTSQRKWTEQLKSPIFYVNIKPIHFFLPPLSLSWRLRTVPGRRL